MIKALLAGLSFLIKTIAFISFLVLMSGTVVALCFIAYISRDLPNLSSLHRDISQTTTKIYDKSGSVLLYEYGDYQRQVVPIEEIPESLVLATLAIEDHDFYEHQGISPRGMLRSVMYAVNNRTIYGSGSTITQQLIKNALLSSDKTIIRKSKEIILAFQIEQHAQLYLTKLTPSTSIEQKEGQEKGEQDGENTSSSTSTPTIAANWGGQEPTETETATSTATSTPTSQLQSKTINAEELFVPISIEKILHPASRHTEKRLILETYFNAIPYGGMAYGPTAAARYYFDKPLADITLAEAALLAALPAAPTYFSPFSSKYEATTSDVLDLVAPLNMVKEENGIQKIPAWKKRQAKVLLDMVSYGYIEREVAVNAIQEPIEVQRPVLHKVAPHFVDYVQERLVAKVADQYDFDHQEAERYIREQGFTVQTSLEMDKQKLAEQVLSNHKNKLNRYRTNNAALVAIRPQTGEIAAMVGSLDYNDQSIDGEVNVTTSPNRQVGSSMKPLVYTYGLEQGDTTVTLLNDRYKVYPGGYTPRNFDRQYHGMVYFRTALANSYNVPAIDMIDRHGVSESIDFLHRMGITTIEDKSKVGLAVVLGATEIKLLDITYAFSVLANKGIQAGVPAIIPPENPIEYYRKLDPVAIISITDNLGNTIDAFDATHPDMERLVHEGNAYIMSDVLSDTQARYREFGYARSLRMPNGRIAAKTGTASNLKDITTLGYYPRMVAGVWCGNTDGTPMRGVLGATHAAPIWNDFMDGVINGWTEEATDANGEPYPIEHEGEGYTWYEQPDSVVYKVISGKRELFLKDNIPSKIQRESGYNGTATPATETPVATSSSGTPEPNATGHPQRLTPSSPAPTSSTPQPTAPSQPTPQPSPRNPTATPRPANPTNTPNPTPRPRPTATPPPSVPTKTPFFR